MTEPLQLCISMVAYLGHFQDKDLEEPEIRSQWVKKRGDAEQCCYQQKLKRKLLAVFQLSTNWNLHLEAPVFKVWAHNSYKL